MSKVFLRTGFNYDVDSVSLSTSIDASVEYMAKCLPDEKVRCAQQSSGDEHDIVNLVDKLVNYGVGVQMPVPISDDFVAGEDFHDAMNRVARARDEFLQLPAHVRSKFDNDPGKFLDFFHDDKNIEDARKMGFLNPTEPETIIKVDMVDSFSNRASVALKKAKEVAGED